MTDAELRGLVIDIKQVVSDLGVDPSDVSDAIEELIYLRAKSHYQHLLLKQFAGLCDGDMENVGGATRLGFDGRLTAQMIKDAKELTQRE